MNDYSGENLSPMNLLVIDDNVDNLFVITQMIKEYLPSCSVTTTTNPLEAFKIVEESEVDGVICDIQMPEINGIDVCEKLKSSPRTAGIPILLITSHKSDSDFRVRGLSAGADDFISRPIDNVEFAARVKVMLRIKNTINLLNDANDHLEKRVRERTVELEQEIKERIESEAKLQKAKILLEASLDSPKEIIMFSVDNKYRYLYFNKSYEKLVHDVYGSWPKIGDHIFDYMPHPKYVDTVKFHYDSALEGEPHVSIEKIGDDDAPLFYEFSYNPIYKKTGEIFGVSVYAQNITERKKTEEALLESEQKYRNIAENVPGLVLKYQLNPDGTDELLYISKGVEELYEIPQEEALKNVQLMWERIHLDCKQKYVASIEQSKENLSLWEAEHRLVMPDGRIKWIQARGVPTRQADGSTLWDTIQIDITDKKNFEDQLLQSQKMESIGALAGGIAHDFNNLLSSIIGFSELALDGVDQDSEVADDIQEVLMASTRAKELISQILDFARKSDNVKKSVQIKEVVEETVSLLKSTIPSNIFVQEHYRSESFILGTSTQIHQVLMNLCTNASQAIGTDGGVIDISIEDVEINERSNMMLAYGEYIKIAISDTGHGIPPENLETIFEPYFTTKEVGDGTGMGLAVVHGIVESYGGHIAVESSEVHGTTFFVYLPITQKIGEPITQDITECPTGTERVLLVDDERSVLKVMSKLLKDLGYQVTHHESSAQALEEFKKGPENFDLVLTDMTMPHMTGEKLAIEIMSIRTDIPVILCTGFNSHISEKRAFEIGFQGYLRKPVGKIELATTVRNVLGRK